MTADSRLKLNIDLYKKMYLIQSSEDIIRENYPDDEMKTPMHMSGGGEAISVGVCHALGENGQVFSSYRSHGVYLAMTEETDKFFAEIYGKDTGMMHGKAGSMHISAIDKGYMGASAIVASGIPLAAGLAFANKVKKNKKISTVFFGDGAIDEGAFWESLNLVCVKELPVLFVCEDNGLAVHSPGKERHGYNSIDDIVSKFDCDVVTIDTTDVEDIYKTTCEIIENLATAKRPTFLHLYYYRHYAHVGIRQDTEADYRSDRKDLDTLKKINPVALHRNKLIELGVSEDKITSIENKIDAQVMKSIEQAQKDPFPDPKELYRGLYVNE